MLCLCTEAIGRIVLMDVDVRWCILRPSARDVLLVILGKTILRCRHGYLSLFALELAIVWLSFDFVLAALHASA